MGLTALREAKEPAAEEKLSCRNIRLDKLYTALRHKPPACTASAVSRQNTLTHQAWTV
jgi:hypothetical protein